MDFMVCGGRVVISERNLYGMKIQLLPDLSWCIRIRSASLHQQGTQVPTNGINLFGKLKSEQVPPSSGFAVRF
jgi:hypothetical protein